VTALPLLLPRLPRGPLAIGLFSPSGSVDPAALGRAVGHFESLGHRVVVSPVAANAWRYFAGTDDERLNAFHAMVADPSIDVMMATRGGYGWTRLLDRIDWPAVRASGKAFVGFSDFTAFNLAALSQAGLVTFHGPMACIDFGSGETDAYMESNFWPLLSQPDHEVGGFLCDRAFASRELEGPIWGGNLSQVAHFAGTRWMPAVDGGILFIEEIAEEPYAVERLVYQLHHAGILARQRALLFADFNDCTPKNPRRYPYSMMEAIESIRALVPIPVLSGMALGHVARKITVPIGAPAKLIITGATWSLAFSGYSRQR
jgi:muramoyltetrapeptide carboxypeptidase